MVSAKPEGRNGKPVKSSDEALGRAVLRLSVATLAQLVEHTLGKGEVVGSSPMGGSSGMEYVERWVVSIAVWMGAYDIIPANMFPLPVMPAEGGWMKEGNEELRNWSL